LRADVRARYGAIPDALATEHNVATLSALVIDQIMDDPRTRLLAKPLPKAVGGTTPASRLLINLLNDNANRWHPKNSGFAVYAKSREACTMAEPRFGKVYAAMQEYLKAGYWKNPRGIRLVVQGNRPLFLQKSSFDFNESALAMTVGDVMVAGHRLPPGVLACIKLTPDFAPIPENRGLEIVPASKVLRVRAQRPIGHMLTQLEHDTLGERLAQEGVTLADYDRSITVASFVTVTEQVVATHQRVGD